jgi:glucose/arabinose dehydrogenase
MRRLVPLVLALAGLLLPGTAVPATAAGPATTVSGGHTQPWGLALLPDGSALFTERATRRIWLARPGQPARHVYTVGEAAARGEGGLLGLALSPGFARDRRVYLYYTTAVDNRIASIVLGSPARPRVVLRGIPAGRTHDGGRLLFGPDGMLYAGTGDAGVPSRAQDRRSLGGKVLRMTPDGRPPADSPFGSVVHSTGHRNVQGLAFDAAGRLWATELGQDRWDEVNLVVKGGNYGWPVVEGRSADPRFRAPAHVWTPAQASPSGATYSGGALLVTALRGRRLWRLDLSGTRVTRVTSSYAGTFGRLRAVARGRDGALWLLTANGSGDRLLRIARP